MYSTIPQNSSEHRKNKSSHSKMNGTNNNMSNNNNGNIPNVASNQTNTNNYSNNSDNKKESKGHFEDIFKLMDGWFGNMTDMFAVLVVIAAVIMFTNSSQLFENIGDDQSFDEDGIITPPSKKLGSSKKSKLNSNKNRKNGVKSASSQVNMKKKKNIPKVIVDEDEDEEEDEEQEEYKETEVQKKVEKNNEEEEDQVIIPQKKNIKSSPSQKKKASNLKNLRQQDVEDLDIEALIELEVASEQKKHVLQKKKSEYWLSSMFNNFDEDIIDELNEDSSSAQEDNVNSSKYQKYNQEQEDEAHREDQPVVTHGKKPAQQQLQKNTVIQSKASSTKTNTNAASPKQQQQKKQEDSFWSSIFDVDGDYSKEMDPGSISETNTEEELKSQIPASRESQKAEQMQPETLELDFRTIWEGWREFDKIDGIDDEDAAEAGQEIKKAIKEGWSWFSSFLANDPDEEDYIVYKNDVVDTLKASVLGAKNNKNNGQPHPNKIHTSEEQKDGEDSSSTGNYKQFEYVGIDDTHTSWCAESCPQGDCPSHLCILKSQADKISDVICADNRYKTHPGKSFLCQASCNQPPFHCPASQCGCENEDMETEKRCSSPRVCNLNEYVAVANTIATNAWCNSTCNAGSDRYCPCTLCECSVICTQGLVNGDFSKGLAGWKTIRQTGSKGEIHVSVAGQNGPSTGKEISPFANNNDDQQDSKAPSKQPFIALMDQSAPGSYVIYQEYMPTRGDILHFSWVVQNWAKQFYIQKDTLNTNVFRNQQFRVDIMSPSTKSWFALGPEHQQNQETENDIIATILSPEKVKNLMDAFGSPPYNLISPWQSVKYDLTPFAGKKILIAFRAVHNQGILNVGIAKVSIKNKICTLPPFGSKGTSSLHSSFSNLNIPPLMKSLGSPACGELCQQVYAHAQNGFD